jgi:hypothetical protein
MTVPAYDEFGEPVLRYLGKTARLSGPFVASSLRRASVLERVGEWRARESVLYHRLI